MQEHLLTLAVFVYNLQISKLVKNNVVIEVWAILMTNVLRIAHLRIAHLITMR